MLKLRFTAILKRVEGGMILLPIYRRVYNNRWFSDNGRPDAFAVLTQCRLKGIIGQSWVSSDTLSTKLWRFSKAQYHDFSIPAACLLYPSCFFYNSFGSHVTSDGHSQLIEGITYFQAIGEYIPRKLKLETKMKSFKRQWARGFLGSLFLLPQEGLSGVPFYCRRNSEAPSK